LLQFSAESSISAELTYDEAGFTTAVAFVNPTNIAEVMTVTAFGADGTQVGTTQVTLPARGKSTNALKSYSGMAGVAGTRGRLVVSVTSGAISVLALRFGNEAFTDIPVNYR